MANWDITVPQGSEAISLGDNRIREMKENLNDALNIEGVFPISAAAPGYINTPSRGNTAARPTGTYLVTGRTYFNTETQSIERYNGATWDDINALPGADVIDGSMIQDDVIDSEHYVAGSIDNEHLAANSVDSDQYVDGSIDGVHIANDQIDSQHYAAGSIDNEHLAANSVDSSQIVSGAIDTGHLSAGVLALMTPNNIQQGSITVSMNMGSAGGAVVTGTNTGAITSVDTSKAYIIYNGHTTDDPGDNVIADVQARVVLTSATVVTAGASATAGSVPANNTVAVTVYFTVVEWN